MRFFTIAISATIVASSAAPGEATPVLDMTTLPTNVGWTGFFTGSATATLAFNVLTLDSPVNTFAGYGAASLEWNPVAADPGGWRVEARARLNSQPVTSGAFDGGLLVLIGTGNYLHFFEVYTDRIALTQSPYSGTASYAMNTMDAVHTYVISGQGANVAVSVDGTPRLAATALTTSGVSARLQFGDLLFNNHTISSWTYFAFGPALPVAVETGTWSAVKSLYRDAAR
jgi:hypothetical protein